MLNFPDGIDYKPKNSSVNALVRDYEKQYLPIFVNIKTTWNTRIREFLRDSTGLKLNQRQSARFNNKDVGIEIVIRPDADNIFQKMVDEYFPTLDFNELERIRELFIYLKKARPYLLHKAPEHFEPFYNYCKRYLDENDINKIIQILFKDEWKNSDVLGSYFYHNRRVEIYYLPIIILSKITGFSLEYAFIEVLAHELAHAYHHIGRDNDGNIWNDMPSAEKEIKEGLAQYYTHLFVEDQVMYYPGLKDVHLKILEFQDGPYIVHQQWLDFKREAVKTAMIMTRVGKSKSYQEFLVLMKDMNTKLTLKK